MPDNYSLTIDGIQITAKPGQTVIQAAMDAGIYVPYLCYWPGMKPYGACRMCVDIVGGIHLNEGGGGPIHHQAND